MGLNLYHFYLNKQSYLETLGQISATALVLIIVQFALDGVWSSLSVLCLLTNLILTRILGEETEAGELCTTCLTLQSPQMAWAGLKPGDVTAPPHLLSPTDHESGKGNAWYLCDSLHTLTHLHTCFQKIKVSDCQGLWGEENGESVFNGNELLVWEDEQVLEMEDHYPSMMVTQQGECT